MDTYTLSRQLPVDDEYDVIVAGGGPAGTSAAVCAAREGARVLLLEASGCLGGMGTSGLVSNWSSLCNGTDLIIGGLMREIVDTMYERGQLSPGVTPAAWTERYKGFTGFLPEGLKVLLDDLVIGAGVELRFFTRVIDVDVDRDGRKLGGVIINNVEGCRYVPGKTFIDATGDAVLTDLCGAPCREAGRDTKHIMPPTLCCVQLNVDFDNLGDQQAELLKAIEDGLLSQPDKHVPGLFKTGADTSIMNAGHLFRTNALDCRSLSDAMIKGRKLVREYTDFYRQRLQGCENIQTAATAGLLGVRESRRIVGEYELTYADFKARRRFADDIAVYCKRVDIHVYDCTAEQYERYLDEFTKTDTLDEGELYGLPYRILVPKGWQNLWVAGRCNSSDIKVNSAIRDQPACVMMGQAAGTAAVQAIETGQVASTLDTEMLQARLLKNGVSIPAERND